MRKKYQSYRILPARTVSATAHGRVQRVNTKEYTSELIIVLFFSKTQTLSYFGLREDFLPFTARAHSASGDTWWGVSNHHGITGGSC